MIAARKFSYKPCFYSYRVLDAAAGTFEVVQNNRTPKANYRVTVSPDGALACTCASGRLNFARTKRGCCNHVWALITYAAQSQSIGRSYSYSYVYDAGLSFAH